MAGIPQTGTRLDRLALASIKPHSELEHITLVRAYPEHDPRRGDPHYKYFNQAKRRIQKAGLWKCNVGNEDCQGPCNLHHSSIEFAYQNEVDLGAFNALFGLHLSDEEFKIWIEEPGNLEVLCHQHHTGLIGVHLIPHADWDIVRIHKIGVVPVQVQR